MSELRDYIRTIEAVHDSIDALEEYAARADGHFVQLRESQHATNNHLAAVKLLAGEQAGELEGHTKAIQQLQLAVGSLSDRLTLQHAELMRALGKEHLIGQPEAR